MTRAARQDQTSDPIDGDIPKLPRTLAELAFFAAGRFPKPDLVGQCRNGVVVPLSSREMLEQVRDLSLGLSALGMSRGDRIALLSESRPEWLLSDLAILAAGAVTTPIYPTLSPDQVAFILRDSGASLAIVSTPIQLQKVLAAAPSLPALRAIVMIDPAGQQTPDGTPRLTTYADVMAAGHRTILDGWGQARAFHDTAKAVQSDDLATIIYTSGTTGEPKGVMLTHANLLANLEGLYDVLDLSEQDVALSFLPLCHALERIVSYVYFVRGVSMIFAESMDTIARDLLAVRPTVMSGVPRVFEKLYARVVEKGQAERGLKRRIAEWALSVASRRGHRLAAGRPVGVGLSWAATIADRLVFDKIREGIGGRLRYAVSGSAPLRLDVAEFFYGLNFSILEGYGLTETSPVISVMPIRAVRFGTVGPPLPNVEVRIASDGEILVRGPNVMRGYYGRPAETAAAVIDGWFHTGDIGSLDDHGYLKITDRKKELLVTSGGKKIAPQPIEARLVEHPLVREAVLVGDRRHFISALVVPELPALAAAVGAAPASSAGGATGIESRLRDPDILAIYAAVIDAVNRDLPQFERIKKFLLIPNQFSIQTGELTPTLKIKRRVVEEKYRDVIEGMYR